MSAATAPISDVHVAASRAPARRATLPRPKAGAITWFIILAWAFLIVQDCAFGRGIPGAAVLRLGVPCLLLVMALLNSRQSTARLLPWIAALAVVGLISSVVGNSIELGLVKLVLYVSVLVPLVSCGSIHRAFAPSRAGLRYLTWLAAGTLVVCGALLPLSTSGIFLNPNQCGLFTVCALPLMLFQWSSARTRRGRTFAMIGVAACLLIAIAVRSRGAVVADAYALLCFWGFRRSPSLRTAAVAAAIFIGAAAGLMAFSDSVEDFAYKKRDALLDQQRQLKIQETFEALAERPFFGYGFGLSWLVTPENAEDALRTGRLSWSVGEYGSSTLAMLGGGGIALVIVFYGMLVHVIVIVLRAIRESDGMSLKRQFLVAFLAGVMGLLANAQAEAWLMAPLTWPTFALWLYCGLLVHVASTASRFKTASMIPGPHARNMICRVLPGTYRHPRNQAPIG